MSTDCIIQEIREALEGRPGQPIVLGVCRTIATRMGWETWCVRLAVIVATLLITVPTLAAYILAGFLMKETEPRTRGFFTGLGIIFREWVERISSALARAFSHERSEYRGY